MSVDTNRDFSLRFVAECLPHVCSLYGQKHSAGKHRKGAVLTRDITRTRRTRKSLCRQGRKISRKTESLFNINTIFCRLFLPELMKEWMAHVKADFSLSYYGRAETALTKFVAYLKENNLYDKPISEITVRDVQVFFNRYMQKTYTKNLMVRLSTNYLGIRST